MITPMMPPQQVMAVAQALSYFSFSISGIIMLPMADTVAGPEPLMAAKKVQAQVVMIARPPARFLTKQWAMFTIRREMPPVDISSPARMK